jgi:predicted ATPase
MANLRKALGENASGIRHITNVPMRGYCLVAPVTRTQYAPPAAASGEPTARHAPWQLPAQPHRLIGRGEAFAALLATLPQRRFVTVVGPGGMGKTTLALAAAAQLQAAYADGAHFVDLASLVDPGLLPGAVATALGVQAHPDDSFDDIASSLSGKSLLLILDNCEHVAAAAAGFAESLLGWAPQVHLLATSREPLRARGEWVQRLNSLHVPPASLPCSFAQAMAFPAFELFVERAVASQDSVVLTDADVPQIAHLCRSLDGMPLALELVAAQIGFFGLKGLVAMVDDRLALPTLGHRTAMARHRTLRATLDWSYDFLPPQEQRLLRCLSTFRERFTLASAIVVAGDPAADTASALMNLVTKSLVSADPGEEQVDYRLLETTRSYAAEKLAATDEADAVARRHVAECRAAVQAATVAFDTSIPSHWRARHGRRIDDVRAALAWSFGPRGDAEVGAILAADAAALYFGLWLVREYMDALEQAMASLRGRAEGGELDMRLSLAFGQACLAMRGGAPEGLAALTRSLSIAHKLGDRDCQQRALWGVFACHVLRGDYQAALVQTDLFGRIARDCGDAQGAMQYHRMMALCLHFLGRQEEALDHARRAQQASEVRLERWHRNAYEFDHHAACLTQLARILWLRGFPDQARQAASDAVDAARAVDHDLTLAYTLVYAACPVALWCGDAALARRYIAELHQCARGRSLAFWRSWAPMYQLALARLDGATLESRVSGSGLSLHISQRDMMATLHEDFVDEEVLGRAREGRNAWVAAETSRVMGERASRAGAEDAERQLRDALALAQAQGAIGWVLRCATSLARLLLGQDRHGEARQLLQTALGHFHEGLDTADVRVAGGLLDLAKHQTP